MGYLKAKLLYVAIICGIYCKQNFGMSHKKYLKGNLKDHQRVLREIGLRNNSTENYSNKESNENEVSVLIKQTFIR